MEEIGFIPKVYENESIQSSMERIPFLKKFFMDDDGFCRFVDVCEKVNKYAGVKILTPKEPITAEKTNKLLEIAYKKGDIK